MRPTLLVPSHDANRAVRFTPLIRAFLLLLAVAALSACGSSGSSDGGSGESSDEAFGSASVFFTDAPSDDFDQILVDVESIELLGGGKKVNLFSGSETIDLKDLEDFSDLFVHAENVPARKYSKIRLRVGGMRLVKNGPDAEVVDVELVANGKIDLIPDEEFRVEEDVDLVIELDLDAKNSIHLISTGSGKYRFRPVVHMSVRKTIAPRKLTRVHGRVRAVLDDQTFALCTTLFMASRDVLESREAVEEGGLGDRFRCMTVELNDLTGVFDEDGEPTEISTLSRGDDVTVVGRFHLIDVRHDADDEVDPMPNAGIADAPDSMVESRFEHRRHRHFRDDEWRDDDDDVDEGDDEGDDDEDEDGDDRPRVRLVLLAYVIEAGPPGTFLRLRGVVESEVNDADRFDFAIDPGQGFGSDSVATALLQRGTRIFTRRGFEVDDSEIVPDTEAKIDGVLRFGGDDDSLLKTALIVLNVEPQTPERVRGEITEIEEAIRRIFLAVESDEQVSEECVDVPEDASILIVRESDELATNAPGEFGDLEVGWHLSIFGHSGSGSCIEAKTIVAFPTPDPDRRCRNAENCEDGEFCNKRDESCDEEGVCERIPRICPLFFDPVCGCDGVTYSNKCDANNGGTSVAHEGRCVEEPVICGGIAGFECPEGDVCKFPDNECNIADAAGVCVPERELCNGTDAPVCGCDGETYRNRCVALKEGVRVDFTGRCEQPQRCGGIAGEQCDEGQICKFEDGVCISDAQGVCVDEPDGCPENYAPVCGCDGETYSNECFARLGQVAIDHRGACEQDRVCGGEDSIECDEGSVCHIEPGSCDENAEGRCVRKPDACLHLYNPVCGCDGETYGNSCVALSAGATIASRGACEEPPSECGGPSEVPCPDGEVCLRAFGSCDSDGFGVCVAPPNECPSTGLRVCGCDGVAYTSQCEAMRESASVVSLRVCPIPIDIEGENNGLEAVNVSL